MGVLDDLAAAASLVVELPAGSGLEWRLRKVSSREVHAVRAAQLAMLPTRAADLRRMASALGGLRDRLAEGGEGLDAEALLGELDDETAEAMASMLSAQQRAGAQSLDRQAALVAAAVTGVRRAGEDWSACRIVLEGETDAAASVLCIHDLPPGVEEGLAAYALSLATDGGAALERLAGFRGGA